MHERPSEGEPSTCIGDRFARFVHRRYLWLLLGCYFLATLWPQPGIYLREWGWAPGAPGNVPISISLLLLAVMLFVAAVLSDLNRIRFVLQHPLLLSVATVMVWLGPALLVLVAGWILPWALDGQGTAGLMVGLALVAAMPVANSSVGWTQSAQGNLALALALVVLSISLSPWATPLLLGWLGMSLSPEEQAYCEQLVNNFSGLFFIIWVLLPTAAGFLLRYVLPPRILASGSSWLMLTSAAALLVLNYINSAVALPKVLDSPPSLLIATAISATALSIVGLAGGWTIARVLRVDDDSRAALMFGLSMKHTGLALILAGVVLRHQPLAILMIVLATLMQHLLAGLVQCWMQREQNKAEAQ